MKSTVLKLLALVLILCVLASLILPAKAAYLLGQLLYRLPWGWVGFLERTWPDVSMNSSGMGMVVLCSLLVIGGTQWIASWLYGERTDEGSSRNEAGGWKWRWTLAGYLGFWLLFVLIMGASGLARQTNWLLQSREPVRVDVSTPHTRFLLALNRIKSDLQVMDAEELRRRILEEGADEAVGNKTVWESQHVVFLDDGTGKTAVILLAPRLPSWQERLGFAEIHLDGRSTIKPMGEWKHTLRSQQTL